MRFICFLAGSGSLIGFMLLVRVILRGRISQGILYALWLVPAVRLLFPFTLIPVPVLPRAAGEVLVLDGSNEEAVEEQINNADSVNSADQVNIAEQLNTGSSGRETETAGISGITEGAFPAEGGEKLQKEAKTEGMPGLKVRGMQGWLSCIWLFGSLLLGGYVVLINRNLKRSIKQMQRLPEKGPVPVYIRKEAVSPCLFGFFHPCILLSEQAAKDRELCRQVLLHEETHYRQKDHIWTAFRIFLCIVYWWNPLVWLGAACARQDAEFACDARALRDAPLSEKKAYGYALLEILQGVQNSGALVHGITPVSGKAENMKKRLENIVSENQKTGLWPVPVSLLVLVFLCGLCFPAQRARAEEEAAWRLKVQALDEIKKAAIEASGPVKKENGTDGANRIRAYRIENGQENRAEEEETGIRLYPQEHREGYREPDLSYTAAAGWLTDLAGREDERQKTEKLARRALRELYDLTGYQVEECVYGYNEIGMLFFARSEEDMKHSRVFYSYSMGEKDGYDIIPSIDIVNARRVWYSDVQQLALPEKAEAMGREELALWFLEHSPLCPEGTAIKIEPVFESRPGSIKLTMEDGTFYEIDVDMEILALNNIYGPYPENAQH